MKLAPLTWRLLAGAPDAAGVSHALAEGTGSFEHGVEHRLGQHAGERVLLRRVVRADDPPAVVELHLQPVGELRAGPDTEEPAQRLVAERTEGHEHPQR